MKRDGWIYGPNYTICTSEMEEGFVPPSASMNPDATVAPPKEET